jgi:hypothetical protein
LKCLKKIKSLKNINGSILNFNKIDFLILPAVVVGAGVVVVVVGAGVVVVTVVVVGAAVVDVVLVVVVGTVVVVVRLLYLQKNSSVS